MAPLIDKLKQSYVPVDVKAAFNQLLEHLHNDELDACIEAGEELLKKRIPDTTRTRVHILVGSCLADPDEMEEHYEKALHLWTLLNAEHANTRIDAWLREARARLDALADAIKEERSDETATEETTTELTMSAITAVESAPVLSSDLTSEATESVPTLAPSSTSVSVPSSNVHTPVRFSMSDIAVAESVPVLPLSHASTYIAVTESVPVLAPSNTSSSDRSSSYDSEPDCGNTSDRSHTTRLRSTDVSPARSASPNTSSVHSGTSRLFGAIALPGQQAVRLHDHVGMSPAGVLKFAWDPNRTVRGCTIQSKTLPSSPSRRPTPAHGTDQDSQSMLEPRSPPSARDTEQYFKAMFEPPSPP
jgi:hypothetical protein